MEGGILIASLGLVLHFVSILTTGWRIRHVRGLPQSTGLFQVCFDGVCQDLDESLGVMRTVRFLLLSGMILSTFGLSISICYSVVVSLGKPWRWPPINMASVACIAGALCNALGLIIFSSAICRPIICEQGDSFALSVIATALIAVGGWFMIARKSKKDNYFELRL